MIKLYGVRNKETGEQVLVNGVYLEGRKNCVQFLTSIPNPSKYEMISQEVEIILENRGQELYAHTKRGPVVVEDIGE